MSYFDSDQNNEIKSEMNIVPMIDILLVLLIVFMIASPMVSSSINVELPKTTSKQTTIEQNNPATVVVTIDKDNNLFITNTALNIIDLPKTAKSLVIELSTIKKSEPLIKIYLKADKETHYRQIMHCLELIKSSGFEDVNLVSEDIS